MPKDYYRLEFAVSRETKKRLESLRLEMVEKTGRHVPMGELLESIMQQFMERSSSRDNFSSE